MTTPIDMILYCPNCGTKHVDAPELGGVDIDSPGGLWLNPPHRSHLCHNCECVWRPADVPTNGVDRLKTQGKGDTWPAEHNEEVTAMPAGGALSKAQHDDLLEAKAERDRLHDLVNSPEVDGFLRGVHLEAVHQVERWGTAHDRAKRPADWFWLVGYLAGKALHAAVSGDVDKARHHCISTAAALYNWHCSITGHDVRMCPGSSDVAQIVDASFPGEAMREVRP